MHQVDVRGFLMVLIERAVGRVGHSSQAGGPSPVTFRRGVSGSGKGLVGSACRLAEAPPSAGDIWKSAVCAWCTQLAMLVSRLSGLPSCCAQRQAHTRGPISRCHTA